MLIVTPTIRIPLAELEFTFARSSGPGGQNVNKVNSKATLRWAVTRSPSLPEPARTRFLQQQATRLTAAGELVLSSQRFRDAGRNVADCLEKLRVRLLAAAQTPKRRRPTKPSRGSIQRRLETKCLRSRTKSRRRLPRED
jgi:ribosome-associated protein